MILLISLGIAVIYALLYPLSEGLYDTSLWVAKILAPADAKENDSTKQFLKISQAALMEGWLSYIPFITSILLYTCIIIGFIYSWWGGILMYFISATLGVIAKIFMVRSVSYYLPILYHKMLNRAVDYKMKNDIERFNASQSYCNDLEQIIAIYQDSQLKPPTKKQLKEIPFGDLFFWLVP
ncbi:MAG: hypothetical protein ACYC6P_09600 [Ignavibacteriaceae bacterium]